MTRFNSINDAIEDWRKKHQRSRIQTGRRSIYYELQIILIMILVFGFYHYPPTPLNLPRADVLILDMTHTQDPSRGLFLDLLDQAHLSHVMYDSVTVNLIRQIPTGKYRIVIFWAHSGIDDMATTERYTPFGHILEQLTGQVGNYLFEGKQYFSMEPGLVSVMEGRFAPGTMVFLMGCNTLTQPGLASAFLRKGASIVVGWKGLVSLALTDTFAISLFQKILQEGKPIGNAMVEMDTTLQAMGYSNILSSVTN